MQNGNQVNGTAPSQPQMMQVNPQQAAAFGLQFLTRVSHTRAERDAFDMAEGLLNAIVSGQVVLAPPAAAAKPEEKSEVIPSAPNA